MRCQDTGEIYDKSTMTMIKTDPAEKAEGGVFRNLLTNGAHSLVVELGQDCNFISNTVSK